MKIEDLAAFLLIVFVLGAWLFALCGMTVCFLVSWMLSGMRSFTKSIKEFYNARIYRERK
jgi:hypothetical protein